MEITVTPEMLDKEYQHLHHARILELLEKARVKYLADAGASMESLISEGIFPVVTDIHVQYRREVRAGVMNVSCKLKNAEDRKLILEQELINERGKLAVTAVVVCMFLNRRTGKAGAVPDKLLMI